MPDKREQLYNNLINSKKVTEREIGTLDQFKDALKDEGSVRTFYKNLRTVYNQDEIGTDDDFFNSLSDDFKEKAGKDIDLPLPSPVPSSSFATESTAINQVSLPGPFVKDTLPQFNSVDELLRANQKQVDEEHKQKDAFEKQLDSSIESNKQKASQDYKEPGVLDYVRRNVAGLLSPVGQIASDAYDYYTKQPESYRDRRTAGDYLAQAKNLQEMSRAEKGQGDWERFFSSFGRTLKDKGTLTFGLNDLDNDARLLNISKKLDKEGYENLSPSEQELLQAAAIKSAAEAYYSSDIGIAQQAGQSTAASIPYMLQFLLTSGAGAAATSGVRKALMSTAKQMLKKGIDKTVTKIGAGILSNTAKAGVMSPLQPAMYKDVVGRMAGNASFTPLEDGSVQFKSMENQAGLGEALLKGYAATSIDNFSEMSGELLGGLGKLASKYGKKIPKLGGLIDKAERNEILSGFDKFSKKLGWHGTPEEFFEEQVGTTLNALTVGDSKLGDLLDKKQQMATLLSVAAMGGAITAGNGLVAAPMKRKIKRNYADAEELAKPLFEEEEYDRFRQSLSNLPLDERDSFLEKVAEAKGFTDQQLDDLRVYARCQASYEGYLGGIRDKINDEVVKEQDRIKEISNPVMGSIVSVQSPLSDKPVNIVGGYLSFDEEGFINPAHSSQTIYYLDEYGKKQMSTPDKFEKLVNSVSLDEAYSQTMNGITDRILMEEEQQLESPFKTKDRVKTKDGLTGEITGVNEDQKEAYVYSNGQYLAVPFDELELIEPGQGEGNEQISVNGVESDQIQETSLDPLTEDSSKSTFPLTKEEKIAYDQITEPQMYADALLTDFRDEAPEVINELISEEDSRLKKAEKIPNAIDRRLAIKQSKAEIERLKEVQHILSPVKDAELPTTNEVVVPEQGTVEPEVTSPVQESFNDKDYAEWALDESDNVDELLSAYYTAKELANVENKFLPWQQELLGKKINPDSFYRFGDRNHVNGSFARAWLKKDGYSIDTLADELSEQGITVTPEDIVDFMQSNPTNYVRKTSDLQIALSRKWSEKATQEAGVPISGPESATGKVFLAMKQRGEKMNPVVYEEAVRDEQIQNDDNLIAEWYAELTRQASESGSSEDELIVNHVNDEDNWTAEDYREIYEAIDNELNKTYENEETTSREAFTDEVNPEVKGTIDENEQSGWQEDYSRENQSSGRTNSESFGRVTNAEDLTSVPEATAELIINEPAVEQKETTTDVPEPNNAGQEKEIKVEQPLPVSNETMLETIQRIANHQNNKEAVAAAEEEVNTQPTEAQKEAGNYKKGHVKVNGFNITIEQPAGSVRSGKDASGKEWSVTMNNTYGYFKGTKGKDGDHIDVFLGPKLDSRDVFVVDQVKPDGSFDEHKVMMGFDSIDEAKQAYLSNYEDGWQGLGGITSVSLEDFKKWAENGTKKRKPFADYKVIESSYGQNNKLVTNERYEELKKKLRSKLNTLNVGFDPELFSIGAEMAAYHIESGTRKFADFAKKMIEDVGDNVRPYLKSFYEGARHFPGLEGLSKEMDSYKNVVSFDVDGFDKKQDVGQDKSQKERDLFSGIEENSLSLGTDNTNKLTTDETNRNTRSETSSLESGRISAGDASSNGEGGTRGLKGNGGTQSSERAGMDGNRIEKRGESGRSERIGTGDADAILHSREPEANSHQQSGDRRDSENVIPIVKNSRNHVIERGVEIAPRGDVAKVKANLAAIQLAKKLLEKGKTASPEEKQILQKYTGWGGLSSVFKENSPYYNTVKESLSEDEYDSARASTTTSFYTPPSIISHVWDMIEKLGFKGGEILEPSAGIGHFFGLMPTIIRYQSNLRGIELDTVSGMILKALYPDAKNTIGGFEEQRIANNSVDLVVSNVPFGDFKVYDKYEKDISSQFNIHDYFLAKSIRKLKPRGLGVFITTTSTLDKSTALRNWVINEGNADFLGAIRLNTSTFKATAGTEASSDIVVIRKRDSKSKSSYAVNMQDAIVEREETYLQPVKDNYGNVIDHVEKVVSMRYNRYFVENPERMAGEMKFGFEGGNDLRPTEQRCAPVKEIDQEKVISDFVQSLPSNIYQKQKEDSRKEKESDGTKEGGITVIDGKPFIIQYGSAVPLNWNKNKVAGYDKIDVLKDYLFIKKTVNDLLEAESQDLPDMENKRKVLNQAYDAFVKKYGYLSYNSKISFLRDDVDFPAISAIENVKDVSTVKDKKPVYEITKSDMFSKRVINLLQNLKADNVKDGIQISIYRNGSIDIPFIARLLKKEESEIEKEILTQRLGFLNPSSGIIEDRNEYLSGNVREKLNLAQQANENGEYDANVEELSKVIPSNIPIHLIKVSLGSSWIPVEAYEKFFLDTFDAKVKISKTSSDKYIVKKLSVGGTKDVQSGITGSYGSVLALDAMNNTSTVIYTTVYENGKSKRVKDPVASAEASVKQTEINELFEAWIKSKDNPYVEQMEAIYNQVFNTLVPKKIDVSSFDYFPGASHVKKPREHQKEGVLRSLERATLLAHEVGTGKTITLISTAMEMRRLGISKKPVIVVQRSTYDQFVKEIKELYPQAKVLVPSAKDLTAAQRKQLFSKIAYNDWDIVVLYHSYLDSIPDNPDRVNQYIDDIIQEKLDILDEIASNQPENAKRLISRIEKEIEGLKEKKSLSVKQEEKIKASAKSRAQRLLDRRTDDIMTFEQLGIDALLIDEAHAYKKLGFATSLQGVKGIDTAASQRAQSLRLKTSYILENNNGKNVVFATGTPISNTMAEMWTFMRYLLPKSELGRLQMKNFDAFVNNFGSIEESSEFGTNGKFRVTNRFSSFSNIPELMTVWKQIAHTVLTEEVATLKEGVGTPRVESGKPIDLMLQQTAPLKGVMKWIKMQLEKFDQMSGREKKNNSHIPLVMFGLAKRAAIDVRLVDSELPDDPQSKLNKTVDEIVKDLAGTDSYKGALAVFCDSYQSSDRKFNVFEDIKKKLIERGLGKEEIAIINDYNTDDKKSKLFDKVNAGQVRVIMGSTEKLGVGVNIQERLHALIHMDAPIRPSDYQQRNGRIMRQGNKHLDMNKTIKILRIGVQQTLDVTGYQRLEIKKKFIDQIMKGDISQRSIEETDLESSDSNNFSQMMATLSGSQAALAYSVEQNKLKKLRNAKVYYEQNQIFLAAQVRKNKNVIDTTASSVKELEKEKETIRRVFPDKEIVSVKIGKNEAHTSEEIETLIAKAFNKRIETEVETLRKDPSRESAELKTSIVINGHKFDISIELNKKFDLGSKKSIIKKTVSYQCGDFPQLKNIVGARVENVIEDVAEFISCKEINKDIQQRIIGKEKAQKNLEVYSPQLGLPFPKENELLLAEQRVNELEAQMKKELADLEAKEAEEPEVEVIDISDTLEIEDERLRMGEGEQYNEDIPAKELAAKELAEILNTPVRFISSELLPDEKKHAKGYFDLKSGEVVFVSDNNRDVADAQKTILHEAVAHRGLRSLLKEDFDDMLDNVYQSLPPEERFKLTKLAFDKYGNNVRIATEEYLATIVERDIQPSIWERVKGAIRNFFRSMGIDLKMKDADIKYMLWKSKNHLKQGESMLEVIDGVVRDTAIKERLYREENTSGQDEAPLVSPGELGKENLVDQIKIMNEATILSEEEKNDLSDRIRNDKFREGWQDRFIPVRRFQEMIENKFGEKIKDFCNVYMYENTVASRSTYEIDRFKKLYLQPLLHIIAKMGSQEQVSNYLKAKHGLERNAYMRKKAIERYKASQERKLQNIKDGLERQLLDMKNLASTDSKKIAAFEKLIERKIEEEMVLMAKDFAKYEARQNKVDYAGLTGLQRKLSDEDAKLDEGFFDAYIEAFEQEHDVKPLWEAVKKATQFALDKQLSSGCIDKSTYDLIDNMYEFYVPLREWEEDTAGDLYDYFFKDEHDALNTPIKKAKGRKSEAGDPLANIASMGSSAIFIGNKNLMKQHFLRLVTNYKTNLVTVSPTWYKYTEDLNNTGEPGWEEVRPALTENMDEEECQEVLKDFYSRMEELKEQGLAKTKLAGLNLGIPVKPYQAEQHVVKVKENGREMTIYIQGNPRVAQAINGLNNVKAYDIKLLKAMSSLKQFMTQNFTTRNPTFVARNLSRDMIYSITMHGVREGAGYTKNFLQVIPGASGAITRFLRGKADMNNEMDRMFQEFLRNGGETGFVALTSYETYKKEIRRMIEVAAKSNQLKDGFRAIGKTFEGWNRWAEDLSRFATYVASRKSGRSIMRSVSDAKEVTVNFNRKGSGAAGNWLANLSYFFLNAGIQGMHNFGRTFKGNPKRMTFAMVAWATLGAVMPVIISALGGDDDDYNNIPDYVRQNSIVIPLGDKMYASIPLPIELRALYGLGDIVYQVLIGNYKDRNAAADIVERLLEVTPRNFIGGSSGGDKGVIGAMAANAMPDVVKPFIEAYITNTDFTGRPIMKDTDYNKYEPEYQRVYKGTSKILTNSSELLNSLTGGDYATKGWADNIWLNPAVVEHLFTSYMGGVGKAIIQTGKTLSSPITGEFALRNVPVASGFMYQLNTSYPKTIINERYQKYIDILEEVQSRERMYEKGIHEDRALSKNYQKFMGCRDKKVAEMVQTYKRLIDEMYKQSKLVENKDKEEMNNVILNLKLDMLEQIDKMK